MLQQILSPWLRRVLSSHLLHPTFRFPSSHRNPLGVLRRFRRPCFFPSLWPNGPLPWGCLCLPTCSDRQNLQATSAWIDPELRERVACEVFFRHSACTVALPSRQRPPRETKTASYS